MNNVECVLYLPLHFLNHSFRVGVLMRESEIETSLNKRTERGQEREQESAGVEKHR